MTHETQETLLANRSRSANRPLDSDRLFELIFADAQTMPSTGFHEDEAVVNEAAILAKLIRDLGSCTFTLGDLGPLVKFLDNYSMKLAIWQAGPSSPNAPIKLEPSQLAQRFIKATNKALETIKEAFKLNDNFLFEPMPFERRGIDLKSQHVIEVLDSLDEISRLGIIREPIDATIVRRGGIRDFLSRVVERGPRKPDISPRIDVAS